MNSDSDSDNPQDVSAQFVPRLPRAKDSDTSDSGLDMDLEMKEQQKMFKDRKAGGKRLQALQQMIKRKNDKSGRTERANKKRQWVHGVGC